MKKLGISAASVLVVLLVAGAAVAILRPEWMPAWARAGTKPSKDYGLFCKEHGVPEKFCTLCHEELKDTLLLCAEHGNLPEDICTLCHPEAREENDIEMCPKGHGLPKHFCNKCEEAAGKPTASNNLIDDGWCAAFGEPLPTGGKACLLLPLVRLASGSLAEEVGIATVIATPREHVHELEAPAETAYDANRYAEISPRVAGFLREARHDLGQSVIAGEVLAVVDSAEVSTAKTQFMAGKDSVAFTDDAYRRALALHKTSSISTSEYMLAASALNQSKASLLNAEQRLRNFRFGDAELARILETGDTRPLLDIVSPVDGKVVYRHAVIGEAVEPTMKLYTVADMARMWLWIDIPESDIRRVQNGQRVRFTVLGTDSASEEVTQEGKVTWVGSEVDDTTRTTKVRAELPNSAGALRANQYGRASIALDEPHSTLLLPKAALQRYEGVDLVFLKQDARVYRPQRVKAMPLGHGDEFEITWGLKSGDAVVTEGSFLLKTEIMRGSIGAGCCD